MTPGRGNVPLPAHRIALRTAISVLVVTLLAGAVSAAPFALSLGWRAVVGYLCVYNALFIGARVAALTLAEEVGRAHGPIVRAAGAMALLFFVAPFVESWAMHFAGTVMESGLPALDPYEGLKYALARSPIPSASTSVGWSQALMTAPFIALAWARTGLGPLTSALSALVAGAGSCASSARGGCPVELAATLYLLPAPTTAIALELAAALERRIVKARPGDEALT